MQSNAAGGDADARRAPRESAPTIDDSMHSSSDAYAFADEEKKQGQQQQQQERSSYYPPAPAAPMHRSSSSATAKTTTTTTAAPTHSAMMSRDPTDKEPAGRSSMGEGRISMSGPPHRQEDYGARHFDIEEEERETGWGLPGPVERPMLRALCLPCTWCLGICNKGSAYGCLY